MHDRSDGQRRLILDPFTRQAMPFKINAPAVR